MEFWFVIYMWLQSLVRFFFKLLNVGGVLSTFLTIFPPCTDTSKVIKLFFEYFLSIDNSVESDNPIYWPYKIAPT